MLYTIADDDQASQGAGASAAMLLNWPFRNSPVSAQIRVQNVLNALTKSVTLGILMIVLSDDETSPVVSHMLKRMIIKV